MNVVESGRFKFTLKAWLVITTATLLLCFLTQEVAKWMGITLPDQANLKLVKDMAGWNWRFVFLCVQILAIMPALEEALFRGLLYRLPARKFERSMFFAIGSSILFSAAHYIAQPFPDSAFIALVFFGYAQCWLYRKTNRIWCSITQHALFNLTNLVLLFIIPEAV